MNKNMSLAEAWEITFKKWSMKDQNPNHFSSPRNCGLCIKFLDVSRPWAKCSGCPILQVTKHKTCDRFPAYQKLLKFLGHDNIHKRDKIEELRGQGLAWLQNIKVRHEKMLSKKMLAKLNIGMQVKIINDKWEGDSYTPCLNQVGVVIDDHPNASGCINIKISDSGNNQSIRPCDLEIVK